MQRVAFDTFRVTPDTLNVVFVTNAGMFGTWIWLRLA